MTRDFGSTAGGRYARDGRDEPDASSLDRLQKRAFGGEDVAARPGAEDDDWWPTAPLLPGVQESIDDFIDEMGADDLRVVFLLGGAGNGKSFAARSLGNALGLEALDADALARRTYRVDKGDVQIELLNDATIAPSEEYASSQSVALAADLERWWRASSKARVAAFCCVNRGIVIDELRALAESNHTDLSAFPRAILNWLASPRFDAVGALAATPEHPKSTLGDFYYELKFSSEGRSIRISAVAVDGCSLLALDGTRSRAGNLFQQVVDRCREEALARPGNCPIRANVQQWLINGAILSWESVVGHAEIASGRMQSYRDIWGLAALSILGPRFATSDGSSSLLDHIDQALDTARRSSSAQDRLDSLLELAHFRVHNALFRAPIPSAREAAPMYPPSTPAHLGLSLVDPSTWGSSMSRKVEHAMHNLALGTMPSDPLIDEGLLDGCWSEFDAQLEHELVEFVASSDCSDVVRRRLVSWYGGYLIRLLGLATGHLGNHAAVQQWKVCRDICAKGGGKLPMELGRALRSVIFPQHDDAPQDSIVVPAFAARVEPLGPHRHTVGPKLLEIVPHGSINLQIQQQGGRLLLECTLAGEVDVIGQLVLDFHLVREALACRGQRGGQTESSAHVEPRIERCRASSLSKVPESQRSLAVMSAGRLMELG